MRDPTGPGFYAFPGDVAVLLGTPIDSTVYSGTLSLLATNASPPARTPTAILPVVGSTPGVNGSFFRTSVQLHNPGSPASGRIIIHPSGRVGNEFDPALRYSLAPGQGLFIPDLLPAVGMSGLGSADVEVETGALPVMVVRVFNDEGSAGTTGFTEEVIPPEDSLTPERFAYLILPPDAVAYRFNIGVRTLDGGAAVLANLYDSAGNLLRQAVRLVAPHSHLQENAAEFFQRPDLPENGRIFISLFNAGNRAFVYGATVDNRTNDPSFQLARPFP
jgi:hypothetical protein